jgi:hypothetical protein
MRLTEHRILAVVIGALTFAITHVVLVVKWTSWFHGQFEPWFLNTASATQLTLACLFVTSLIAGLFEISGLFVWLGAAIAMVVVMSLPPGPGTLWPIAMAIGGFMLALAILSGSMLGLGVRYLVQKMAKG